MFTRSNHPVIRLTLWLTVSLAVPALPIAIGIFAAVLQGKPIELTRLLDGIELLLISLGMIAATYIDLARLETDPVGQSVPYFMVKAALFVMGVANLIFLTLIYINNRVASLDFEPDINVALALGHFALSALCALTLQYYVNYNRFKMLSED